MVPITEEAYVSLKERSDLTRTTKCNLLIVQVFDDGTTKVKKNLTDNQIKRYWAGVEKRANQRRPRP